MSILVTGAAGFIGTHLVKNLLLSGEKVIGIDNFDPFYDKKIKLKNLESNTHENFTFIEGDLSNKDDILKALNQEVECVVHLAAKAGVRPSLEAPKDYVKANLDATVTLLETMKEKDIKNFCFASSSSIYGKTKDIPFSEEATFENAISIYATTKQSGELFTQMYHNLYNFNIINLRFFTVYGPGQRPDLAIHKFLKANLLGETINVFGDGSMARDYTFVSDTVEGIVGAVNRLKSNSNLYETYNLGNNTPVKLADLINEIEKVTGKACVKKYQDIPLGDVPITFANIDKAKENLGYNPKVNLEEGLQLMFEWIKKIY